MDITATDSTITALCGALIAVGLLGIVVPILPGLVLTWLGVLVWALLDDGGSGRWLILAAATVLAVGGVVVKYAWPGRRLNQSGVPRRSLMAGGLLGLVGFFVIPVVGLVIGFVLGVWLAERARLGDARRAWPSTRAVLAAVGLSMLIELAAGLGVAGVWVLGLLTV